MKLSIKISIKISIDAPLNCAANFFLADFKNSAEADYARNISEISGKNSFNISLQHDIKKKISILY